MKPPYSMIKLRSCDNQAGVWFHKEHWHRAPDPDEPRFCL